jgi:hypothetical protein
MLSFVKKKRIPPGAIKGVSRRSVVSSSKMTFL